MESIFICPTHREDYIMLNDINLEECFSISNTSVKTTFRFSFGSVSYINNINDPRRIVFNIAHTLNGRNRDILLWQDFKFGVWHSSNGILLKVWSARLTKCDIGNDHEQWRDITYEVVCSCIEYIKVVTWDTVYPETTFKISYLLRGML